MAFINLDQLRLPFQANTARLQKANEEEPAAEEHKRVVPEKADSSDEQNRESYLNTLRRPALSLQQSNLLAQQSTIRVDLSDLRTVVKQDTTEAADNDSLVSGSGAAQQLTEEEAIAQGYTVIKTAEDLQKINDNLDGKYILMGDIDMSEFHSLKPIGNWDTPFTGEFNGNGYTISNFSAKSIISDEGDSATGLFGCADGAEFSNVSFVDAYYNTSSLHAIHGGEADPNGDRGAGMLVGYANNCTIDNCSVEGKFIGIGGALAGRITNTTITNCNANISKDSNLFGGLVNIAENSTIENCNAFLNGECNGGIVYEASDTKITNCYTSGSLVTDGLVSGGIAATAYGDSVISNCSSECNIKSISSMTGGIVGLVQDNSIIEDCVYSGSITSNATDAKDATFGGIAGEARGHASIIDCKVTNAELVGTSKIGGILGRNSGTTTIKGCDIINLTLQGEKYLGGIVGYNNVGSNLLISISEDSLNNIVIKDSDGNVLTDLDNVGTKDNNYIGKILGRNYAGKFEITDDPKNYKFPDLIDMVQDKKDMEAAAKEQNLSVSDCSGVYQKRVNGKTVYYVWNSNDKEFELAGDIQSINSDGTYTDRYGNKYNRPYNEQVAAHAGGYTPTVIEGVYEKDGKYYNFNNGTGEFVEINKSNFVVDETQEEEKNAFILNSKNNLLDKVQFKKLDTISDLSFKGLISLNGYTQTATRLKPLNQDS